MIDLQTFKYADGDFFADTSSSFKEYVEHFKSFVESIEESSEVFSCLECTDQLFFIKTISIRLLNDLKQYVAKREPVQESVDEMVTAIQEMKGFIQRNIGNPEPALRHISFTYDLIAGYKNSVLSEDTALIDPGNQNFFDLMEEGDCQTFDIEDGDDDVDIKNSEDEDELESSDLEEDKDPFYEPERLLAKKERLETETFINMYTNALFEVFWRGTLFDEKYIEDNRSALLKNFKLCFRRFCEEDVVDFEAIEKLPLSDKRREVFELVRNETLRLLDMAQDPTITNEDKKSEFKIAALRISEAGRNNFNKVIDGIKKDVVKTIVDEEKQAKKIGETIKNTHEEIEKETRPDDTNTDSEADEEVNNEAVPEEDQEATEETPRASQLVNLACDLNLVDLDIVANQVGVSEAVDRVAEVSCRNLEVSDAQYVAYCNYLQRKYMQRLTEGKVRDEEELRSDAERIAKARHKENPFENDKEKEAFIKKMMKAMHKGDTEKSSGKKEDSTLLIHTSQLETAPPDEEIEKWITKRKPAFRKRYGDRADKVLYGRAWKMYKTKNPKASTKTKTEVEDLELNTEEVFRERTDIDLMYDEQLTEPLYIAIGGLVSRKNYEDYRQDADQGSWASVFEASNFDSKHSKIQAETNIWHAFIRTMTDCMLVNCNQYELIENITHIITDPDA